MPNAVASSSQHQQLQVKPTPQRRAGDKQLNPLPPRVERLLFIIAEVERHAQASAQEQKP